MKKKFQIIILTFSVFVFFLGNVFNISLSIPTFKKLCIEKSLSGYQVIAREFRDSIEGAERIGRTIIDRPIVVDTANDLKRRNPDVENIVVSAPDERFYFSLNRVGFERHAPTPWTPGFSDDVETGEQEPAMARYKHVGGFYHVLSPLRSPQNRTVGIVDVVVREEMVQKMGRDLIVRSLKLMAAVLFIASFFMMIGLLIWVDYGVPRILKKNICIILFLFLAGSQLFYSCYMVNEIESERITRLVNESIESSREPPPGAPESDFLEKSEGVVRYTLAAWGVIWKELNRIIADALTILLITFIFSTELVIFQFIMIEKFKAENTKNFKVSENDVRQPLNSYSMIRPDAFILLFSLDLSSSFMPLYTKKLYTPFLGLTKEFILGLPISSAMICACMAFLVAGSWIDRHGWRACHFRGVLIAASGLFLAGIASTSTELILYRGVLGFGYGLTFISFMGFVHANTNEHIRTIGFAVMSAGMFSGSICGGAVGGMLAERIGYSSVFFVSTILVIMPFVFPYLFMRHGFEEKSEAAKEPTTKINGSAVLRFCLNRNIIALLLLLSIPAAVIFVGFLYHFCPLYLDSLGVSQANIARVLMINGIGLIYLSPLISPIIDRSKSKRKFLVISGVLSACAVMIFSFADGVVAVIVSIAVISVAAAFGNSPRTVYALQQKAALDLGSGLSMSIYRAVDRLGWVLGPIVIGLIFSIGNIRMGLMILGAVCLVLTLLFFIVSVEEKPLEALPK